MDRQKLKRLRIGDFKLKRMLYILVCWLGGVYLSLLFYACFFTEKAIFHPPSPSYADTDRILKLPTADGARISAVYMPLPHARYTLLYSHGNGEDIGQIQPILKKFNSMGYSVLAYDYRGYGTSPGAPSEANAYADEEAACNYLVQVRGVPADRIIAIGHSLGAAMAADLASHRSVAGLVLDSAFVSADRVVTQIPLLPFDKFQNLAKIGRVHCPVLVIHGSADGVIPLWHGKRLFAEANEPKRALWVEGAGHNDLFETAGPRYGQALQALVALIEAGPPH